MSDDTVRLLAEALHAAGIGCEGRYACASTHHVHTAAARALLSHCPPGLIIATTDELARDTTKHSAVLPERESRRHARRTTRTTLAASPPPSNARGRAMSNPADDPLLGDDGYPSEIELQRIREWPWEDGFRPLMAYILPRWQYADAGYWRQRGDRFAISTAGWSGNESIIDALEANTMFAMLCPVSWRRGGHYVYDVQDWDSNPDRSKRKLVRDPATPMIGGWSVAACDCGQAAIEGLNREGSSSGRQEGSGSEGEG